MLLIQIYINSNLFLVLQVNWINDYHTQVRDEVGAELKRQGKQEALKWMMKETQPIG